MITLVTQATLVWLILLRCLQRGPQQTLVPRLKLDLEVLWRAAQVRQVGHTGHGVSVDRAHREDLKGRDHANEGEVQLSVRQERGCAHPIAHSKRKDWVIRVLDPAFGAEDFGVLPELVIHVAGPRVQEHHGTRGDDAAVVHEVLISRPWEGKTEDCEVSIGQSQLTSAGKYMNESIILTLDTPGQDREYNHIPGRRMPHRGGGRYQISPELLG